MNKINKGFTLIELIIVLLVLAILAAIAVPRYLSLTSEAKRARVENVAAVLETASVSNLSMRKLRSNAPNTIPIGTNTDCVLVLANLLTLANYQSLFEVHPPALQMLLPDTVAVDPGNTSVGYCVIADGVDSNIQTKVYVLLTS